MRLEEEASELSSSFGPNPLLNDNKVSILLHVLVLESKYLIEIESQVVWKFKVKNKATLNRKLKFTFSKK